jgi:MoxR-like ATPase
MSDLKQSYLNQSIEPTPSSQAKPELIYHGRGQQKVPPALSLYDGTSRDSPEGYFADANLADAVNTAIFLKQPLLVMGEPGTGKTQLAHSIAWEFGLPLHKFNTKMNSAGGDLFYHYDSLLHFHDTQIAKKDAEGAPRDLTRYVKYAALGKAILFSHSPAEVTSYIPETLRDKHREATRSVVLIDEIDKAPRDFPNDILAETEELFFEVRETGWSIRANPKLTPILIFTSNQERNLPEAFLRRCIYFYIPFPEEKDLREIVRKRLSGEHDAAIRKFLDIRLDDQLVKKPATAELIAWLRELQRKEITPSELSSGSERVRSAYSILLKNKDDFERYVRAQKNGTSRTSAV